MKKHEKSLATLVGATVVGTLSASAVNSAENPFALRELDHGYTHVAEATPQDQAKSKEAKCGAEVMKSNPEMKCGAEMMNMQPKVPDKKAMEGKCAAGMKMDEAKPDAPKAP